MSPSHHRRGLLGAAVVLLLAAACGSVQGAAPPDGKIHVVACQNAWGSIAAQLGGSAANVRSIATDPAADPHEYESNAGDARSFATAGFVILNGAGYDDWARKLLDANPSASRRVLTVAAALGRRAGDNPHFWYDPDDVLAVADRITAEYAAIKPGAAGYFQQRRALFAASLRPYLAKLAEIRQRFAGSPVGATETVFAYLARYLRLNVVSPPEFMQAVSEGNDPPARAVAEFQLQLAQKQVRVLVYNVQTATAVTANLRSAATRDGIPVVGISETVQPASATFQEWQERQLAALETALGGVAGS